MSASSLDRDSVTRLLPRSAFEATLSAETARAARDGRPLSLALLDLDHFKSINDAFGHVRGDEVLVELSSRLRDSLAGCELLFRYGGDEFVALLPDTDEASATERLAGVLERVRATPFAGTPSLSVSLSIGVAELGGETSGKALFRRADQRLYEAKRRGRGRVVGARVDDQKDSPTQERILGQEESLGAVHAFLRALPDGGRGVLRVDGPRGSGRSRFLAEAVTAGRVLGFEVVEVRGRAGLRTRMFGALQEAGGEVGVALPLGQGSTRCARYLAHLAAEKARSGVLIVVDDLRLLDPDSVEFLAALLADPESPILGVVHADAPPPRAWERIPPDACLHERITLQPLGREGVVSRIRTTLKWEPPEAFVDWFDRETRGLPGAIALAARALVDNRLLVRESTGWSYDASLLSSNLEELTGSAAPPLRGLPPVEDSLVGRDREIAEIRQRLAERRLVTLQGPGGIGKTRLALQAAAETAEGYSHGACFVALESLESADFILSAVADALRFDFAGRGDPASQLCDFLREKELLLVLDNFEHVMSGTDLVSRILNDAPGVRVLVTSRERLNLFQESVVELGGMSVPPSDQVTGIEGYTSVQFFLRRARQVKPDLELAADDRPAVVRICRMVEGTPLALELAASLLRVLSVGQVAAEMERSMDALAVNFRDRHERHRSLRGLFDYSWVLLTPGEQAVLRALGVFQVGFEREVAERVAGASLPVLTALVDKSLLRLTSSGRYELHGVYRGYVKERLHREPGEEDAVRERHCRYFAEFVRTCADADGEGTDWPYRIGEERDNLRFALRWAVQRGMDHEMEALVDGLFRLYNVRGWCQEGDTIFGWAVERVPTGTVLQARLLARQGCFAARLADLSRGRALLRRSVRMLQHHDLPAEVALPLSHLGQVELEQGRYRSAMEMLRMSLDLYRRAADREGVALTLNALGVLSVRRGKLARAERLFSRSLRIRSRLGDRSGMARCLINLGSVADFQGQPDLAERYFRQSHAASAEVGDDWSQANSLHNLGVLMRREGELRGEPEKLREAWRLLERSLDGFRELGARSGVGLSLYNLGDTALLLGDRTTARWHLREALRVARDIGALPLQLTAIGGIARLLLSEGDRTRVAEVLAVVTGHPATPEESREQAEKLLVGMGYASPDAGQREASAASARDSLAKVIAELVDYLLPVAGPAMEPALSGRDAGPYAGPDGAADALPRAEPAGMPAETTGLATAELVDRARTAERESRRSDARRAYEAALYRMRTAEEGALANEILRGLGRLFFQEGSLDEALDSFEAALAVAEAARDEEGIAYALNNQAAVLQSRGDLDPALVLLRRARSLARRAGAVQLQAMVEQNLGIISNIRGDYSAALEHYRASLDAFRAVGQEEHSGYVLNNLGMLHTDLKQWDRAERRYLEALESCERSGNVGTQIMVEVNRAELWIARGGYEAAMQACRSAFDLARQVGDTRALGELHKNLGIVHREMGELDAAETHLARAGEIARERKELLLAAETAREQAELFMRQRRNQETLRALNQAHRIFSQLRARRELSDVDARLADLEGTFLALVRHWGESIESADNYTHGHCERVADYACALARAVGFDEKMLLWFRMGALLHDVGKIVVPPEVLNKPGRLTDEERALIERHPDAGVELLGDLEFPWDIRPMIRLHHEQWAGGGYPTGIAGTEIPLAARILCIADVFDALSSDRPYRPAFSADRSLEIMRESMRHHFDPELFEIWETLVESGIVAEERTPTGILPLAAGRDAA